MEDSEGVVPSSKGINTKDLSYIIYGSWQVTMTAWFFECYTKSDLTSQTIDWSSPRSGLAARSALAYLTPVDRPASIPNEGVDAI